MFSGEPYTVARGTVIDEALTAVVAEPSGTPRPQDVKDKLAKAPSFFAPDETELDADPQPAAAQPCFLRSVDPRRRPRAPPTIRRSRSSPGRERFYSSGFLFDEAVFEVELAKDIAPGTHQFMCLVDRTDMTGHLTEVGPKTKIPTPAEVRTRGQRAIGGGGACPGAARPEGARHHRPVGHGRGPGG